MRYEEFQPSPDVVPWVANHWKFEIEAQDPEEFEHVIVPDGTLSISFSQYDGRPTGIVAFAGPSEHAHRVVVRRNTVVMGARVHPAFAGALLSVDASTLKGRLGMLEPFAPSAAALLSQTLLEIPSHETFVQVLERALRPLIERASAPPAEVVTAVDALLNSNGAASVQNLTSQVGLSARQLRRLFAKHVGLSPKELARVRRIRHACILMLQDDSARLAGVSADVGYTDQPHLNKEFKGIFQSSPRLVEAYLRQIEHFSVKP